MGIPSFYKKISKKFPKCIKHTKDMSGKVKLYFDFNGLIHTVLNESEQYELLDNNILFKKIVMYYDFIVDYIQPSHIMVAIDGVCPRAKMIQQRMRRYRSVKDKRSDNQFDRNCVSPGTKWMKELCKYLTTYFKDKDNVIFYGAEIPGEGEHTIFKHIRNDKENCNYVVYGLDADLIMLSFVSMKDKIFLLRERQSFDKDYKNDNIAFNFLDIDELKKGLIGYVNEQYQVNIKNVQQFLDDFVFFTFLLGNDFMPHLNSLSINNKGIELLIKNYIDMRIRTNSVLVNRNLMKVNTNALCAILRDIVKEEDKLVQKNSDKIYMNKDKQLNYYHKNWKTNYYYHFFQTNNKKYIEKVCNSYCEMLNWTFKYYFDQCPAWRLQYDYRAAPCLSEIYNFIFHNDLNKYEFDDDVPYTQNQQLMMILPPNSRKLFPKQYVKLIDNELMEFYPRDYLLEMVDKAVDWMYEPIIPEIDDEMILEYVKD